MKAGLKLQFALMNPSELRLIGMETRKGYNLITCTHTEGYRNVFDIFDVFIPYYILFQFNNDVSKMLNDKRTISGILRIARLEVGKKISVSIRWDIEKKIESFNFKNKINVNRK